MTRTAWRPTVAHLRATVAGALVPVAAVLLRRPDLLVIALPSSAIAVWSAWRRPAVDPVVEEGLEHGTLREGEATSWHVRICAEPEGSRADPASPPSGDVEDVTVVLAAPPSSELDPRDGTVSAAVEGASASVRIGLRSVRWGRRRVGPAKVVATSPWAAFRWSSLGTAPRELTTLPLPSVFDTSAPIAQAVGLVGLHRSARPGDGSEFASIRPFHVGDRLRRIHWPRSLRSGALHVTSTYSDQDSHIMLLVDALNDLGTSTGIDGLASSLDTTVRAAGAIAEHHLRQGDRVSLHVIGARGVVRVPPATGANHLRRILDTLATVEPGSDQLGAQRMQFTMTTAGALVVMLSPLVSPLALQRAITLARRGVTVVVIDTLPADVRDDDPDDAFRALAWRIRLLERRREIRRVQEVGVPVVTWRGPGSLDQVLRDLHRRAGAPRIGRR